MNQPENIITSTSNEKMKRIRALSLKKNRDEEKLFIVEGLEHIEKALRNGWKIQTLLFTKTAKADAIIKASKNQNAAIYEVTEKVASYVTQRDNPQNIIAVFKQKYNDIEIVKSDSAKLWLGLEDIKDPGNLGTIIRTADAVGTAGILLIGITCDAFSPEVIRATTGSFSSVPLIKISRADFIKWRNNFNGSIIGTHLYKNSVDYREIKLKLPALLLMGSEQDGLSNELVDACDIIAKIPMREGVESLNLAISTAIMLYQLKCSA